MYYNCFSTILYIISDNSLITLMKSGMTKKYWFVKYNWIFYLICFVFPQCSIYYTSNTSTEEEHQFFFAPW